MRKPNLSEAQMEDKLKELRNEIKQHELAMEQARYDDSLSDYESAKGLHDVCVAEIESIIQKLHPYVPREWYDKYGQPVIPDREDMTNAKK